MSQEISRYQQSTIQNSNAAVKAGAGDQKPTPTGKLAATGNVAPAEKTAANKKTAPTSEAAPNEELRAKEPTIPSSIRLRESAFNALKALMVQYAKNITDMTSICIIEYAKKAAAAVIVKYRTLEDTTIFALQRAATDIHTGLSNFRHDLYEARKSNRDPVALKEAYETLAAKRTETMEHAEDTLSLIAQELLITEILTDVDPQVITSIINKLANREPANQLTNHELKFLLKILNLLKQ